MKRYISVIAISAMSALALQAGLASAHAATKTFSISGRAGKCVLKDGVMKIRDTGRVSWRSRVASSNNGDDAYCMTFSFLDRNGTQVFSWPRICSQTLYPPFATWSRDNLAVPEHLYGTIRTVRHNHHC